MTTPRSRLLLLCACALACVLLAVVPGPGRAGAQLPAGGFSSRLGVPAAPGATAPTLRKGAGRGIPGGSAPVRELQAIFTELGYPLGTERGSGVYGVRTQGAVAYFQRQAGLEVSGTAGFRTTARLRATLDALRAARRGERAGAAGGPLSFTQTVRAHLLEVLVGLSILLLAVALLPGRRRDGRPRRSAAASAAPPVVLPEPRGRLGETLVASGALRRADLALALREQRRGGGRLGAVLQAAGAVEAAPLRAALAAQSRVEPLSDADVPVAALAPGAARSRRAVVLEDRVPRRRFARTSEPERRPVAFADPTAGAVADLERQLGKPVRPVLVDEQTLDALLGRAYGRQDAAAVRRVLPGRRALRHTLAGLAVALVVVLPAALVSPWLALLLGCLGAAGLHAARLAGTVAARRRRRPVTGSGPAGDGLPELSLVLPLQRESATVVASAVRALRALDYPAGLLQGIVVCATDNPEQARAFAASDPPAWLTCVSADVRGGEARTALALHGIRNARGTLTAVLDARRPPEADHLRRVVSRREQERPRAALRVLDDRIEVLDDADLLIDWRRPGGGTDVVDTAAFAGALGWKPGVPAPVVRREGRAVRRGGLRRPVVWVCIPTYNEAENVAALTRLTLDVLRDADIDGHVLVVDDGSPDGTGALADALAAEEPRLHVLHRTTKEGIGPAYVAGFAHALAHGADLVAEMDCDFSHDPAALPELIAAAQHADVVLGSRYVPGGAIEQWSAGRRFVSRGGSAYARTVLGVDVRDLTGGFKVLRRAVLEALPLDELRTAGYGFQVEVTFRALRAGFSVAEVPITFRDRAGGTSKMDRGIAVEAAWAVLQLRRERDRLRTRPPAPPTPIAAARPATVDADAREVRA